MHEEKNSSQANITSITELFGELQSRQDILETIKHSNVLHDWEGIRPDDREKILLFLEGRQGLQILSDKFFRKVFRPDDFPERIESLISEVLGEPVKIVQILSREGTVISESGSQVIMDIVVKTESGAIVNVEMQRIGYYFPGERSSCYTSDLIMRQYSAVRAKKGLNFSYSDLKPVTLIVIMEKSTKEFISAAPEYIHRKITTYSSGINVANLDNVVYISLDTFKKRGYNKISNKLEAWLSFFTYEQPEEIISLVNSFPEFVALYKDIAEFRRKPEEVIGMFSEALRIMDHNTTKYMIEDLQRQYEEALAKRDEAETKLDETETKLDETETKLDETETKLDEAETKLGEAETKLGETETKLDEAETKLGEAETKLGETETKLGETEMKLDEVVAERDEANAKIATKDKELAEKDREIAELKARLAQHKQ